LMECTRTANAQWGQDSSPTVLVPAFSKWSHTSLKHTKLNREH